MKTNKTLTVTVGVPSYNEVNNIGNLLRSILKQETNSYRLQKIVVVCDGSTDGTPKKVREIAKKNKVVSVIYDKKRRGKAARLNQIYRMNRSDLVFTFDADTVLADFMVIEKMVSYFKNKKIAIVFGNKQPVDAQNLVEKLINTWLNLTYEFRKEIDGGDNVYNISGCALALRKSFSKQIVYPQGTIFIGGLLHKYLIKNRLKFKFAPDARILFRSPNNLYDYLLQIKRVDDLDVYSDPYDNSINKIKKALVSMKLKKMLKMLMTNPIYIPLAIMFHIFTIFWPITIETHKKQNGFWETVVSSKKAINFVK